jgi:hypothetical protein
VSIVADVTQVTDAIWRRRQAPLVAVRSPQALLIGDEETGMDDMLSVAALERRHGTVRAVTEVQPAGHAGWARGTARPERPAQDRGAGAFDPTMRSSDDNLAVFAELVGIDPA